MSPVYFALTKYVKNSDICKLEFKSEKKKNEI